MSIAGNFLRGLGKLAPGMMGKKKPKANVLSVTTEFDEDGRERTVSKTYDNDITIKPTHRMADKIEHIRNNMLREFHADEYENKSGKPYDNPWARSAHVHSENCEHNNGVYSTPNYSMNMGGNGYGGNSAMNYGRSNVHIGTGTRLRAGVHDPYDLSQSGKGAFDHLSGMSMENKLRYGRVKKSRKKDIPSYGSLGF